MYLVAALVAMALRKLLMTKPNTPAAGHNSGASLIVLAQNYFSSDKKAENAVIAAKAKRALLFDTLEADGIDTNFHLKYEDAEGNKVYSDVAKDIRAAWVAARYGKDGATLWAAYEADPSKLTKAQKKKRKAMTQQLGTNMAKLAKQYEAHIADDDDTPASTFTIRLMKAFATAKDRLEKYDPEKAKDADVAKFDIVAAVAALDKVIALVGTEVEETE